MKTVSYSIINLNSIGQYWVKIYVNGFTASRFYASTIQGAYKAIKHIWREIKTGKRSGNPLTF